MIKALIFDYDGVMSTDEYGGVADICPDAMLFEALEWKYSDVQDASGFLREARAAFGFDVPDEVFWAKYNAVQENGMLTHLKDYPHMRLFLLSNQTTPRADYLRSHSDLSAFEQLFFSNEVRLKKPDPAIFRYVLEKTGCKPEECVFIDDSQDNIDAAKALGIQGVLFQDVEQCRRDINTYLL